MLLKMSKRKPTNLPEVELLPDLLNILQDSYNIGLYEDIINLSALDTAFNYDSDDDNYDGINFNNDTEIDDTNVEDVYGQTSPSKNRKLKQKYKRQQKAFATAKAKADDLKLQYKLPVESVYIDLVMLKHDMAYMHGLVVNKRTLYRCENYKHCKAKTGYTVFKVKDIPRYVLTNHVEHNDQCSCNSSNNSNNQQSTEGVPDLLQKNFPIKAKDIMDKIDIPIIADPTLSVPVLLNFLQISIGPIFDELNRSHDGSRPFAYTTVYNARQALRQKYCGGRDGSEYAIIPSLVNYLYTLDADTEVYTRIDKFGNFENLVIIPGMAVRGIKHLLNTAFIDAAHMHGLGQRDGLGKSYLATMQDGNHKSHLIGIGTGGSESTPEWLFFLKFVFDLLIETFGKDFNLFADEHASIRAAIKLLAPDFENFYLCMKHRQGNVNKNFGPDAADAFMNLSLAYTRSQYLAAHDCIVELSAEIKSRYVQQTLYEYIFGVAPGEKQESSTKRILPSDREHEYCRYIRLKKGISCHNFASTAPGEGVNCYPGTSRSPFGRGFLRKLINIYCVIGYYIWYITAMKINAMVFASSKKKYLTPYFYKLLETRLQKIKDISGVSNQTTLQYGTSASTETTKENDTNTVYKVTFPRTRGETDAFEFGQCECGMYQEWKFPCKHAMFIIYSRIHENSADGTKADIPSKMVEKVAKYIVEKKLCDPRYTRKDYTAMLEKMKVKEMVVPNLQKIIALSHDVRLQGSITEYKEIHIPKGPKFSSSRNSKGEEIYTDKWHTRNTKVDPSKPGVKTHARKKSKGKGVMA